MTALGLPVSKIIIILMALIGLFFMIMFIFRQHGLIDNLLSVIGLTIKA